MPRYHSSSSSSSGSSSNNSARSYSSSKTYDTDITTYNDEPDYSKPTKTEASSHSHEHHPVTSKQNISPRSSVETYASTIDIIDNSQSKKSGPCPRSRYQCYEPDAQPATSNEFSVVFPSTRRLMIQHDETTEDGNMNIHVDTEVTTTSGRRKKLTLFHLRMKDLKERNFSIRRYCRDSGREVASCKKHYIKSAPSTPTSRRSRSSKPLDLAFKDLSMSQTRRRADSGYASAESEDEDEDERLMEERLNLMTTPADQIISKPTESIRIEFSNYAQIIMDRQKDGSKREYAFEYWGDSYVWKREKQVEDGEVIYSFDLIKTRNGQKQAIIMPDALSASEAQWEAKQGGWIPASSMRLLKSGISDDLGDVIMTTGLIALTDDSMRRHFHGLDQF